MRANLMRHAARSPEPVRDFLCDRVNVEDRCLEAAKDVADQLPLERREAIADRAAARLLELDFREIVREAEARR